MDFVTWSRCGTVSTASVDAKQQNYSNASLVAAEGRAIERLTEDGIAFGDAQKLFKHPPAEARLPLSFELFTFYLF